MYRANDKTKRRRHLPLVCALMLAATTVAIGVRVDVRSAEAVTSGTLTTWGTDGDREVSNTPSGAGFVQVAAGYWHSLALREDGSIASWGTNDNGLVSDTPTGAGFTQVSAGPFNSAAIRADGSIAMWGGDLYGHLTNKPTGIGFVQVDVGAFTSVALRANGSIVAWGLDGPGSFNDTTGMVSNVPTGNNFVQVSAGWENAAAVKSDGSLVSWGNNVRGVVSNTPTGNDFVQVSVGLYSATALRSDGTMVSWGTDAGWGELSNTPTGSGFAQVSAGIAGTSVALRNDGTLAAWGRDDMNKIVAGAPTGGGFTQVSAGGSHMVALKSSQQTISFPPLGTVATTAAPFSLSATATSGLPVSFESLTTGVCTVSGSIVTLTGTAGTCSVEATQAGDSSYPPATPVQRSFDVTAPAVVFRLGDVSLGEGSGPNSTTVSVVYTTDRPVAEPLCVWYFTTDGTGTGSDKFTAFDGTQDYLRVGVTKAKSSLLSANRKLGKLSTKVNFDSTVESDETFSFVISKVTAQESGRCVASSASDPRVKLARPVGVVTSLDDDTPLPVG